MQHRLAIGIGTAVAVLAVGGGITALTWPSTSEAGAAAAVTPTVLPPDPSPEPPRIKAALNSVDIAASGNRVEIPQRDTKRFSLLGITWSDPADEPNGTIEVRTRSVATGKWTGWQALEKSDTGPDGAEAAAPGRRGATEPLWAGPSDGVAVRIAGKEAGLPKGLRLDLTDPGEESGGRGGGEPEPSTSAPSPAQSGTSTPEPALPSAEPTEPVVEEPAPGESATAPEPTGSEEPAAEEPPVTGESGAAVTTPPVGTIAGVQASTTAPIKAPFPSYYSRKSWSADETIVGSVTDAKIVNAVWVHHTGTINKYECSEAPAIIRSIQTNDVKSKGLDDVGYNYFVDKCGRLFEGRRGGVENAIVPAATVGFNTGYAAVAVIGDYMTAASAAAIETIVAQIGAARLAKYGFNPADETTLTAGAKNDKLAMGDTITVARLAGHRDADATLCPGANLYAKLDDIRAKSQLIVTGLALKSVSGNTYAGAYHVKTAATLNWLVGIASADIAKFDILLDGKTVASPDGTARSATVAIPAGKHVVTVVAWLTSGSTARVGAVIYGDTTAPIFSSTPRVELSTGTYNAGSVPVRLYPNGTDNLQLAGYTVSRPRAATLGPVSSWATTVKPGAATWTVTARDVAGNTRAVSLARTVVLSPETAAKKTGTWTKKTGSAYLGGKALAATKKNAKLTWTFTGRSASLLFSRAAKTGKVVVYVDGKKVTTLDLKSSKTLNRQAVWTRNLTYGKHTVAVVVQGTSGRPTVVSDGLAYIR